MARLLITGGAGFIGSHLAERLLADGHSVTILDDLSTGRLENVPNKATFVKGDVCDEALLKDLAERTDGCFHLAAIASVARCSLDPLRGHQVNTGGFVAVINGYARRSSGPAPVVYASSAAVYGELGEPAREDMPLAPLSLYGAAKAGCEMLAKAAGREFGLPTFGLRLFNVYGPRQSPQSQYAGVITAFLSAVSTGNPMTIYGDGNQLRDFVYVGDAVSYFIEAMRLADADAPICNAATGQSVTVLELAQKVRDALSSQAETRFHPMNPRDIRFSAADTRLSQELFGWTARTNVDDGLRLMLG